MLYFDTSFLAPLILEEPTSVRLEEFLQRQTDELATSHWARIELSSLLAREAGVLHKEGGRVVFPFEAVRVDVLVRAAQAAARAASPARREGSVTMLAGRRGLC